MELTAVDPSWIDQGSMDTVQLDLTGARQPALTLEASLLDGVTSVTPRVAYIGFRAWTIMRYWQARQPEAYSGFIEFAGRQEAALAIGLARLRFAGSGVIGSTKAWAVAQEDRVTLAPLVVQSAAGIYATSFDALHLGGVNQRGVPNLTPSGRTLAEALEARVSGCAYARALAAAPSLSEAPTDDLAEFAERVCFDRPGAGERAVLADAILGIAGPPSPLPRRDTYSILLSLFGTQPKAGDTEFLRHCTTPDAFPEFLARTADGWAEYAALDLVAFSHEMGLETIVTELAMLRAQGVRSPFPGDVMGNAAGRPELAELLDALGLPGPDATVADLRKAMVDQCGAATERNGIRRWSDGWVEEDIAEALWNFPGGRGAGPLLAWCCAAQRVSDPIKRRFGRNGLWSLGRDILPFLAEHNAVSIREAVAGALRKVASHHLRVAWERYANDSSKNNALLATEGGRWRFVRDYQGKRMGRRFWAAKNWLEQLGMFDASGFTELGKVTLDRMHRQSREVA